MRKILTMLSLATLFIVNSYATVVNDKDGNVLRITAEGEAYINASALNTALTAISSTRTLVVIDIYAVGGATTTSMLMDVGTSSFTFRSLNGVYHGTATFVFTNQTYDDFVDWANAVEVSTPGIEGGLVAVLRQGAYGGNQISSMTVTTTDLNIHSSTNTVSLTADNIIGMTYTIPATAGESNYITSCDVEAGFSSGRAVSTIYDGSSSTDTILKKMNVTTLVTNPFNIGSTPDSYIVGSAGQPTRIDIVNMDGVIISTNTINATGFTR